MGQVHFENFDFLVKVKGSLGQSIFFFFLFFFFFGRQFGPGHICGSVKPVSGGRRHQCCQMLEGTCTRVAGVSA